MNIDYIKNGCMAFLFLVLLSFQSAWAQQTSNDKRTRLVQSKRIVKVVRVPAKKVKRNKYVYDAQSGELTNKYEAYQKNQVTLKKSLKNDTYNMKLRSTAQNKRGSRSIASETAPQRGNQSPALRRKNNPNAQSKIRNSQTVKSRRILEPGLQDSPVVKATRNSLAQN